MDRLLIANAIAELYRRRLTNEWAPCLECFADDVVFKLAGESNAGFSTEVKGQPALQPVFASLTETWKWTEHHTESVIIEGSKAAVRFKLTATHAPTGSTITTEIMDEFVFDENQKIVTFIEFVDTAAIARLNA